MVIVFIFFRPNPNSDVPTLRLIDFGCAIDMKFFEPKTQFKKVSSFIMYEKKLSKLD